MSSINITNSVTSIGNYVFSGCSGLKKVIIEDGIEVLSLGYNSYRPYGGTGEGVFYDCPLTTLHLGRKLSYEINK
ncbi:MAG: leucine-rich repeat protein [Prevotella sp.]|nr:leucine-rich repeat protein [Prevotella sp.]